MKKAGILSMQRIYNYGSFLQAYGLKKMLEELGCDVEFVDYHPGKCLVDLKQKNGLLRKLSKSMEVLMIQAPLKAKLNFIKYKKNFGVKYHSYLGIGSQYNYNPELDILVIGSDEVFNFVQDNPNVGYTAELFGVGSQAETVISYAASFGNTTMERLKQYGAEKEVAGWLNSFNTISVRDNNSYEIVKELTGKAPELHLDPVLMYDYMKKCPAVSKQADDSDYLVLYGYTGRFSKEECRKIREYAIEKKLKILCIGGIQHCCDKFVDCSPFEVFSYFKNAYAVITDTFHGTIISIITQQRFATFVRSSGYGNAEKVSDLLKRLNLEEQIVFNVEELGKIVEKKIDYLSVNYIIENERKRAYQYLNNMLEKGKEITDE